MGTDDKIMLGAAGNGFPFIVQDSTRFSRFAQQSYHTSSQVDMKLVVSANKCHLILLVSKCVSTKGNMIIEEKLDNQLDQSF